MIWMCEGEVWNPIGLQSVWQHFGFKSDELGQPENLDEPICKLCLKSLSAKDCNTLNLTSHLNVNHPLTYADLIKHPPNKVKRRLVSSVNQPGILGAFAKTTKYRWDSARWKSCTSSVANYLVKNMLSFHTAETKSFKSMVETLDPQVWVVTAKEWNKQHVWRTGDDMASSRRCGERTTVCIYETAVHHVRFQVQPN